MTFPFEVTANVVESNMDQYIDAVFDCLESDFLVMPKGEGFVEFPAFEMGYEALKRATASFERVTPDTVSNAVYEVPLAFIVLRCMLGLTPPEWAYEASRRVGEPIPQGMARSLDRRIRMNPEVALAEMSVKSAKRIRALITAACEILQMSVRQVAAPHLHRFDKADTFEGLVSVRSAAYLGVPYSMLLYERMLGRPFASHRDSVSEMVGRVVEDAIEDVLIRGRISFRKTARAERLPGFDQAPDFVIPNEFNPQVVIEAKLTEDDGTARDKVTRVQHLASLSVQGASESHRRFQVIACIAGRGFGVRREDMRKLLIATRGKVFTLQNMNQLVEHSRLHDFAAQ